MARKRDVRAPGLALALVLGFTGLALPASAQSIGTFRWQQQPYCNVFTLDVIQTGAVFEVRGTDDQCGGSARPAAATGLAVPNPDGSISLGLSVVTSPGGQPLHLDVVVLGNAEGTWQDSNGSTGAWRLSTGGGVGSPRPLPSPPFSASLSARGTTITQVGTPASPSDAANRAYVDAGDAAARAYADAGTAATRTYTDAAVAAARSASDTAVASARTEAQAGTAAVRTYATDLATRFVNLSAYSAIPSTRNILPGAFGCQSMDATGSSTIRLDLPLPIGATLRAVRIRYRDGSTAAMTFAVRQVTFADQTSPADSLLGPSLTSSNGTNLNRVETLTLSPTPPPVTDTRSYYLEVTAPGYTGTLAFCGAQALYSVP